MAKIALRHDLSFKKWILLTDFCYSGGFIDDFNSMASAIMTSNREEDQSHRWNVMFYSRLKGDNMAPYYRGTNIGWEGRSNRPGTSDDRYVDRYLTADGCRGQISNPQANNGQNQDRDLKFDDYSTYADVIGLYDDIVSINEAMIFTDAVLADANDFFYTT